MLERVIENWLDRASELSFQMPFCQMLTNEGHKIVHLTRHCGMELGKDIITISPDGTPCAYQLKGAPGSRITLRRWLDELNMQAFQLVVGKVNHPSIITNQHHEAYFVTNGTLDEEVIAAIEGMNRQWSDQGMSHLRLRTIVRGELLAKAHALEGALWPTELTDVKTLLELYLHDGGGPLPKSKLVSLLEPTLLLTADKDTKPPSIDQCSRAIASTGVLCSLACSGFTRELNHVAVIEAWTLYVAHVFALAAKRRLPSRTWRPQIDVALLQIQNALMSLYTEVSQQDMRLSQSSILDQPFTPIRLTIVAGMLCVLENWPADATDPTDYAGIQHFCAQHRCAYHIWSEASVPYLLALFWHFRRHDPGKTTDSILEHLIRMISVRNHPDSAAPLANPYWELAEILPHSLGLTEQKIGETFQGRSYFIESLVHMFVRRNWKRAMKLLWPEVTRVASSSFTPAEPYGFFLWRCKNGEHRAVLPKHTQSWDELVLAAEESEGAGIPDIGREYPHFILLYLLVCPHRASPSVIRWLDSVLAAQ